MPANQVPENEKGLSTDTVSEEKFEAIEDARQHYQTVKQRFLDINNWHEVGGKGTARFTLRNAQGEIKQEEPQKGDYFEINIPAPGNEAGDGADWVQIINTEEVNEAHTQSYLIRVQPAESPLNARSETAHFFDSDASSTFIIRREGNIISAGVHGRNETPNNQDPGLKDKVRNTIVAIGAMLGFSKIQWKSLVNGLVKVNDDGED